MTGATLYEWIDRHARERPSQEAAVQGAIRWSYAQLQDRSLEWAAALLNAGVRKGDRVAVLARPSLDYLATFLGATAIGAIWVGLNPRYTTGELLRILTDAQPRVLAVQLEHSSINEAADLDSVRAAVKDVTCIALRAQLLEGITPSQQFLDSGASRRDSVAKAIAQVRGDDQALLVYTSGTTGNPKGAMISQGALVTCSDFQARHWRVDGLRILNNLPINHIGCVGDITCFALASGGTIVFMEQFDPEGTLRLIQDERLTVWGQVPTMFQLALDHPSRPRYDLSSLRLALWSGAGAAPALIEKLLDVAPLLATSYGLTESVGSATFTAPTRDMRELSTTVGVAAPHFQVRVVNDSDQDVAAGEPGEVLLKSSAMFSGYWRNEEATHAAFDPQGWFRTGDVGALNAAGELRIIGRRGDRFKSGGYNVYPREIELVLERHPLVAGAAVIGVEDPLYGEVGEAFIATPDPTAIEETQLQAYCRDHLANYKVPKRFHLLRELPMLPIGKVDKQLLERRARERI